MRFPVDRHSLPTQIILGFILVVLLTTASAGLPGIWLIRTQLDRQAWLQVEQGLSATEALYGAEREKLARFADLVTLRIAQKTYAGMGDRVVLEKSLEKILAGTGIDFILVCSAEEEVAGMAGGQAPVQLCRSEETKGYYVTLFDNATQAWIIAAQNTGAAYNELAKVLVGIRLDQEFVSRMQTDTGLHHTLLFNGQPIVSSFQSNLGELSEHGQKTIPSRIQANGSCWTFELDCEPYFAARLPLNGEGLEAQVALAVSGIPAIQRQLLWILVLSMIGVTALGSGLGILFAQRISKPLVKLAQNATQLTRGESVEPVFPQKGAREVVLLSRALETARVDLIKMMTDLQQEKAWSEHLLEAIVEGIMTLDDHRRISFFSRGAERITGWSRDEVIQRGCDEVFRTVEGAGPFCEVLPKPGQQKKVTVYLAGKRKATLSFSAASLTPAEGGQIQSALVFRDVSEEDSVHRLLGQFMANVAHEFRTPLSALAASIELLRDQGNDFDSAEMEEVITSLHLGILRFQNLVDNLLESANIEAGHFRISPRPYDLDRIVSEAINTMQPLAYKYGQRLTQDLPEDLPLVMADPRRTVQVLVNLISNASKYGPVDAQITIRAKLEESWISVFVEDRGPGIPFELQGEVFRRFHYPGDGKEQTKVGAGLGLSVVKAVVEAHGGKVGVEERMGGGSAFWFKLPVAEEI